MFFGKKHNLTTDEEKFVIDTLNDVFSPGGFVKVVKEKDGYLYVKTENHQVIKFKKDELL